jgi:IS30 family transposase
MFENGKNLRLFLRENGIEITKIATQLSVTRQTIDRWLTENKNLDKIYEAAARPFSEYINTNKTESVNESVVIYQANRIMELEKEVEKLKLENVKLRVQSIPLIKKDKGASLK